MSSECFDAVVGPLGVAARYCWVRMCRVSRFGSGGTRAFTFRFLPPFVRDLLGEIACALLVEGVTETQTMSKACSLRQVKEGSSAGERFPTALCEMCIDKVLASSLGSRGTKSPSPIQVPGAHRPGNRAFPREPC